VRRRPGPGLPPGPVIARGTSDNAAVYGSYLLQAHAGMLATLASPSIATEYHARMDLSGGAGGGAVAVRGDRGD